MRSAADCVAVSTGTDALVLALRALGIRPGDRVIVPANTFFASVEAVSLVGAVPVLVDCDPLTRAVSVDAVERELRAGGAAGIIAVHLYGHPADIDALAGVAAAEGAWIDRGRRPGAPRPLPRRASGGARPRIGCFSFYPSKNLGATGEGGAITTDDADLADAVRVLRHHGQPEPNRHELVGCNGRLSELIAAALRIKLRRLERWTAERRRVAAHYARALAGAERIRLPYTAPWADPVWHLYAIEVDNRDAVARSAAGAGRRHRSALPDADPPAARVCASRSSAGAFPEAERSAARVLSLPMFPELSDAQVDRVVAALRTATEGEL